MIREKQVYVCDFCGSATGEGFMKDGDKTENPIITSNINGIDVCICGDCVDLCVEVLKDKRLKNESSTNREAISCKEVQKKPV